MVKILVKIFYPDYLQPALNITASAKSRPFVLPLNIGCCCAAVFFDYS